MRWILSCAVLIACCSTAFSDEVINDIRLEDGDETVRIWYMGSEVKPGLLLLSTDGSVTDHILGEVRRYVRMGYAVAAMNVQNDAFPDSASLSGAAKSSDYAARIKVGLDFLTHTNNSAIVNSSRIGLIGWGFGANGVLAAAVAKLPFHVGVCNTPDLASDQRADLSMGTDSSLLVFVDYAQIAEREGFEANLDMGNVTWDVSILSGTKMHFNVMGHTDYQEEQARRSVVTTRHFLDDHLNGDAVGTTAPPRAVASPMVEEHVNYTVLNETYPGVIIYDASKATAAARKPAVVVLPAWSGYGSHELLRQIQFAKAEEGYVTMSANIYGLPIGQVYSETSDKMAAAGAHQGMWGETAAQRQGVNAMYTDKILAAVTAVKALPYVDGDKVAVLGFCFGGTGAYNVFRFQEEEHVSVGVSMHGNMMATREFEGSYELHGDYLLMVSGGVDAGEEGDVMTSHLAELSAGGVDWEVMRYSEVLHGFSEWASPVYNARAEGRGFAGAFDVMAKQFGTATADTGCTLVDYCSCDGLQDQDCDGFGSGSEETDGEETDGEETDGEETDGEETDEGGGDVVLEWTCAERAAVEACAGQLAEDGEVDTGAELTAAAVGLADCYAVSGCCDDFATHVASATGWCGLVSECGLGACAAAPFKVELTLQLAYSVADFDSSRQRQYRQGVAALAEVALGKVRIVDIADASTRRRLLADAVNVKTSIEAASQAAVDDLVQSEKLTLASINEELATLGLSAGTLVQAPTAVVAAPADPSASALLQPVWWLLTAAVLAAL